MLGEDLIGPLSAAEANEVLRRAGASEARFARSPSVEAVAERAGLSVEETTKIVRGLRSLGAAIDTPSGDLEAIRIQSQTYESLDEDPRALARVATEFAGVQLESGEGRRLPKATRNVLLIATILFLILVVVMVVRTPPRVP